MGRRGKKLPEDRQADVDEEVGVAPGDEEDAYGGNWRGRWWVSLGLENVCREGRSSDRELEKDIPDWTHRGW